jgi:hypothetical protein
MEGNSFEIGRQIFIQQLVIVWVSWILETVDMHSADYHTDVDRL